MRRLGAISIAFSIACAWSHAARAQGGKVYLPCPNAYDRPVMLHGKTYAEDRAEIAAMCPGYHWHPYNSVAAPGWMTDAQWEAWKKTPAGRAYLKAPMITGPR